MIASLAGFFYAWPSLPWQLGLIVALACGSLLYVVLRVVEDLLPVWLSRPQNAPRNENERNEEQEIRNFSQGQSREEDNHPGGEGKARQEETDSKVRCHEKSITKAELGKRGSP